MKKLLTILLLTTLISCSKQGEIIQEPKDFIIIHNKTYKLMSIVPCNNCNSIWILYPKDSTEKIPEIINFNVSRGKTTVNESVIKVN